MTEQLKYSSKEVLQALEIHPSINFDAQQIYQMERDIEEDMAQFNIEKRKKAAMSIEELSKIVITA